MSIADKAENTVEKVAGQVKEEAGKHNEDPQLAAEGRKEQIAGDLKNAVEHAKDAFNDIKSALNH